MSTDKRYGAQERSEGDDPKKLLWRGQEVPFDDPDATSFFDATHKQLLKTKRTLARFASSEIAEILAFLGRTAATHDGLDYTQVFSDTRERCLRIVEYSDCIVVDFDS